VGAAPRVQLPGPRADAVEQLVQRGGGGRVDRPVRQPRGAAQLVRVAHRVAELEGAVVVRGLLLQVGLEAAREVVDVLGIQVREPGAHGGGEGLDAGVEGGICGVHGFSPIVRTFADAGTGPSPVPPAFRVRWVGAGAPCPLMAVANAAQVARCPASSSRPSGLIA
jgi:hypothetical protein